MLTEYVNLRPYLPDIQWRIQTFADGGANRDLSDNVLLPQHIVL